MTLRVLAIGDSANLFHILSKFVKKSKIHVINFPLEGAALFTYSKDVEFFKSIKAAECVKRINEIKNEFDLCITMGICAYLAYLAGLNYIIYYVGDDIRVPMFRKKSHPSFMRQPLFEKNFLERRFHKKVLENAIACVTGGEELFLELKKYRNDAVRIDNVAVDTNLFNSNIKPVNLKKTKFTFLSPERFGVEKGFDMLWDAIRLCKSDFEILQVEWYDKRTTEELEQNKKLLNSRPSQVKLIPLIRYNEMANYYMFADAMIGDLRTWSPGGIERETAMCKKPIISYQNPNAKSLINGKMIEPPFLPKTREPKILAELIDKIVECEKFRIELAEQEYRFIKELADPHKAAEVWEDFFEKNFSKTKSIKNASCLKSKFRLYYFLIINRLYVRKLKKLLLYKH